MHLDFTFSEESVVMLGRFYAVAKVLSGC